MRRLISGVSRDAGVSKDSLLLGQVQESINRNLGEQAPRWKALSLVSYQGGRQNWQAYADASLDYGNKYAAIDN